VDIRNGLQLECIHCTACIDACDGIMDALGKPRGLIRYASAQNLETGRAFRVTRRAMAYLGVMTIMVLVLSGFLAFRSPVEFNVFRTAGFIPRADESGQVTNMYTFSVLNKTTDSIWLNLDIQTEGYALETVHGDSLLLPAKERVEGVFLLQGAGQPGLLKDDVRISVNAGARTVGKARSSFTRPFH
jgi:polyferredoxin